MPIDDDAYRDVMFVALPNEAKRLATPTDPHDVLAVIVEVGFETGTDVLAAYRNHVARYVNQSARLVVWERADTSLDARIDAVLSAATPIARNVGVWRGPRRPAPANGIVRINVVTEDGLSFGEGPFAVLASDAMAAPVIDTATVLMQSLIAIEKGANVSR